MTDKSNDRENLSAAPQTEEAVWKHINHRLFRLKTSRLRKRHDDEVGETITRVSGLQSRNNLIWGYQQWLKVVWETYREVWKLQGQKESPEFLRVVVRKGILPFGNIRKEPLLSYIEILISRAVERLSLFNGSREPRFPSAEEHSLIVDQMFNSFYSGKPLKNPELQAEIDAIAGAVEKICIDWESRIEIKAIELSYRPAFRDERQEQNSIGDPTRQESTKFEHSADYTWVKIRGQKFTLTQTQAKVVQILNEAREEGKPDVSKAHILSKIERETSSLRDIFRSSRGAQDALVKEARRGVYRLNL